MHESLTRTRHSRAHANPSPLALSVVDDADRTTEDLSEVFGHPFHRITLDQAVEDCAAMIRDGRFRQVVTANVDFVVRCCQDGDARSIVYEADRIYCDGMPLVWLSRVLGCPLPERVAGSDLTPRLLARCATEGWGVFLFGGDDATLAQLHERLPRLFPGLRIVGSITPPYAPMEAWDHAGYVETIRRARPEVFLAALGFPKQERWIRHYLKPEVDTLAIGVGASLDFLVGKQVRAPKWMQRIGMEWLWRMAGSPGRLAGRYAKDFRGLARLCLDEAADRFRPTAPPPADIRVGNGLRRGVHRIALAETTEWDRLGEDVAAANSNAVVLDGSSLSAYPGSVLRSLLAAGRAARRAGKSLAVFEPGRRLAAKLRRDGLDRILPVFRHPLALECWAERQAGLILGEEWRLRLPAHLTSERLRFAETCIREVQPHLGTGDTLWLSLADVHGLGLQAMMTLARWCEVSASTGPRLRLAGANPRVEEQFRIVGLERYLESGSGPLELEVPRTRPSAAAYPDRIPDSDGEDELEALLAKEELA